MKDIYLYVSLSSWQNEQPDAVVKGEVISRNNSLIEIKDESGFTQIINLDRLFVIVY